MSNSLFRRKDISSILSDSSKGDTDVHSHGLRRVLTVRDLTFFGIAAIIGAGSFSSLGEAVYKGGPGVVLLFVITGIACAFTALCYSEFASTMVFQVVDTPDAGMGGTRRHVENGAARKGGEVAARQHRRRHAAGWPLPRTASASSRTARRRRRRSSTPCA